MRRAISVALLLTVVGCQPHPRATIALGTELVGLAPLPPRALDIRVSQVDVIWSPSPDGVTEARTTTLISQPGTLHFATNRVSGEPESDVVVSEGFVSEIRVILEDPPDLLVARSTAGTPMAVRFAHAVGLVLRLDPTRDLDGDRPRRLTAFVESAGFTSPDNCTDWNDCSDWLITYRDGTTLEEIEQMAFDFGALVLGDDTPFHQYVTIRPPKHAGFWDVAHFYDQFPSVRAALPNFPLYVTGL